MASSKAMLVWILVLRLLALSALAASVVILATNQFETDGEKVIFTDIVTYRYVLAAAGIGVLYSSYQLPFAMYHAIKEERLVRNDCAPEFDFYGDKIVSWLLAAGVGAGLAATYELKKLLTAFNDGFGPDDESSKRFKFLDKGYVAVGLLFVGFVFVAMLSVLSSITRSNNGKAKGRGFFFG